MGPTPPGRPAPAAAVAAASTALTGVLPARASGSAAAALMLAATVIGFLGGAALPPRVQMVRSVLHCTASNRLLRFFLP